jgi:hypothetical protein
MGGAGEAERGGQMAQAASRGGRATLLEVASRERSRRARGRRSCQHRVGLPAGLGARCARSRRAEPEGPDGDAQAVK